MAFAFVESKTALWRKVLMSLIGMGLAGCAGSACCGEARPVVYMAPAPAPADVDLQACVNHAASAAKESGQDFKRLRFDTLNRVKLPFDGTVGDQYVATVQDGVGQWQGRKEWRQVHYHCLSDASGNVLYSFVRAE